jgi:hypothetical protein
LRGSIPEVTQKLSVTCLSPWPVWFVGESVKHPCLNVFLHPLPYLGQPTLPVGIFSTRGEEIALPNNGIGITMPDLGLA